MGRLVRLLIALSLAFGLCAARPALALDTGDIVVASLKGEVHIAVRGAEVTLRAGSKLELPASVRTGRDGSVELRQGATSISVGPESLLEFPALASPGGSIDRVVQPRGTSFYNVGKRGGRKLRIETPFLVGVVKGTQFSVVAQDHATTISLFEGLLEVRSADDSDVIDLHAGEIATRDRIANEISVLKMDAGATPPVQKAPATKPAAGGNGKPAASPAHPVSDVVGNPINTARDNASKPVDVSLDVPSRSEVATSVEVPAGNGGANVDVSVARPVGGPSVDVSLDTPANGTSVEVSVDTPANGGGVSVDVGVETPASTVLPSADVALETPIVDTGVSVDVGAGSAVLDTTDGPVDVGVSVDQGGAAGAVDVVDGAATVDLGATGDGVSVDVGVGVGNTQVDLGVDLGAVTDVDLGLVDDDSDNSGHGSDNSGSGSSGSGSDNSGSGSDNSGPGNANDVIDGLLDSLTRRSGNK